jgi:hypothetical protein
MLPGAGKGGGVGLASPTCVFNLLFVVKRTKVGLRNHCVCVCFSFQLLSQSFDFQARC